MGESGRRGAGAKLTVTVILILVFVGSLSGCAGSQKATGNMTGDPQAPSAEEDFEGLPEASSEDLAEEEPAGKKGAGHKILWYIPNRLFDVLDPFRARVRVGPGFSVGARATTYADVFLGSYLSVFAGLPGPRGRRTPRLPFGIENYQGAKVSVLDGTASAGSGPNYGTFEIGADLHVLLVGVALGIEPVEVVDFATGILFIDPMKDDI